MVEILVYDFKRNFTILLTVNHEAQKNDKNENKPLNFYICVWKKSITNCLLNKISRNSQNYAYTITFVLLFRSYSMYP